VYLIGEQAFVEMFIYEVRCDGIFLTRNSKIIIWPGENFIWEIKKDGSTPILFI